jgi:hypothetical protein
MVFSHHAQTIFIRTSTLEFFNVLTNGLFRRKIQVYGRCRQVTVAEHFLQGRKTHTPLQRAHGERVPQDMWRDRFRYTSSFGDTANEELNATSGHSDSVIQGEIRFEQRSHAIREWHNPLPSAFSDYVDSVRLPFNGVSPKRHELTHPKSRIQQRPDNESLIACLTGFHQPFSFLYRERLSSEFG